MRIKGIVIILFTSLLFLHAPEITHAAPLINLEIGGESTKPLDILIFITLLSFLPAIIVSLTCYIQVVIVLSLTRQALGTPTAPPNQVINGLAIILTLFIMAPVGQEIIDNAYKPYSEGEYTLSESIKEAEKPLKKFMVENADEKYIKLAAKLADVEITTKEEVPFLVATVGNLITQIHNALGIAGFVMLGFIVIDMIVASILMLLGMFMLPPNLISLPIKIITFLAIGGYELIIEVITNSFKV